jgi:hypothetical protein
MKMMLATMPSVRSVLSFLARGWRQRHARFDPHRAGLTVDGQAHRHALDVLRGRSPGLAITPFHDGDAARCDSLGVAGPASLRLAQFSSPFQNGRRIPSSCTVCSIVRNDASGQLEVLDPILVRGLEKLIAGQAGVREAFARCEICPWRTPFGYAADFTNPPFSMTKLAI